MMKLLLTLFMYNLFSFFFNQYKMFNYMILIIMMNILFKLNYINLFNYMYLSFMTDSLNLFLIMLILWTILLAFQSNFSFLNNKNKLNFHFTIMFMMLFLMMFFFSMNLLYFYIFFECSMIPIMLIIMGWGNQIDRIQALMYMLFYTLFGSLPLILIIFIINFNYFSMMMNMLIYYMNLMNIMNNLFIYLFMILGFLIKIPLYCMHLWLPKAHVESPISGSMILASIMLKLGTYGFLRLMLTFKKLFSNFNKIIMPLLIWGTIMSCIVTININDLKIINAYSSIIHMNSMMFSMLTNSYWSLFSSKLMMLSHGLCSSAIFCLINFYYERLNSRNIIIIKGLTNFSPIMSLWWFLFCMSNISAPPSLNFFSEIMLIISMLIYSKLNMILIMLMIFLSSLIYIYFYSISQHNNMYMYMYNMKNFSKREYLINFNHFLPIMFMIMFFNLFF
uniref:NADH-ubiquinone oxidoreductase chain 4 n=1 Tax=Phanerotoma flava TaxID=684660 RepID=D8WHB0_9HYME|nr:NADH dehydrogenase subunit 4 [Phanerotoma flava]